MGAVISSIARAINTVIGGIAMVIVSVVSAITMVILSIWDLFVDILCCRCRGRRSSRSIFGRRSGRSYGTTPMY
ncbi:hypothetical protein L210DRAFT_949351 [Boletus edulis BED1]|uniref:Uncharacterized protein n=1 Tax=Boletus edulis BED1 TaxID=1328754 RepID=A0AAD4GAV9_BOLED|nr:hypothetical protein L210DRAFT_949351 [Boletus edulis BED1]